MAQCRYGTKEEGYTASVWDQWSRQDSRYRDGEPYRKWDTFQDSGLPERRLRRLAKENGWQSKRSEHSGALDWNSSISNELQVVDSAWVEDKKSMSQAIGNRMNRSSGT
ncbi:PriCT-2 domain-containing protein [Dolosigranulum pigrum]|uniref:PriCT-2 domain-containing protein n=1 Tax=Dolosigranulum pigrum TaxID=29394 RepID=UPI001FCBAC28|nr:PriCT-2 domain-containing protein [Dolosigranulum pigrum]